MLSNSAFNALLKTLEEPPPHVKFIFATTESRKIPVTILSRCQRFDLKRIEMEMLAAHLGRIAAKEQIVIEDEALKLIAVAAEGSVRDSLSLLDQAIAAHTDTGAAISATAIRQMIGSADKTATFRLLETLLPGNVEGALGEIRAQYQAGADPLLMVQDSLEVVHLVTRVKVAPLALTDIALSQHDREAAKSMADRLTMPVLTRLWQMLLKGITEVRMAPSPLSALEMLVVRVAYAAQLPLPAEVIKQGSEVRGQGSGVISQKAEIKTKDLLPTTDPRPLAPTTFEEAVALFDKNREPLKYTQLRNNARLVTFSPGRIELSLGEGLPRDFHAQIAACLTQWTGGPWKVIVSEETASSPTLHEQEMARKESSIREASAHPLVSSVLEQFPGARLVDVSAG